MSKCAVYEQLLLDVEKTLSKLAQLTTTQLQLFKSGDYAGVRRVDKELELCVGAKERSIGALRQHAKEHNCQAAFGLDY